MRKSQDFSVTLILLKINFENVEVFGTEFCSFGLFQLSICAKIHTNQISETLGF